MRVSSPVPNANCFPVTGGDIVILISTASLLVAIFSQPGLVESSDANRPQTKKRTAAKVHLDNRESQITGSRFDRDRV